MATGVLSGSFAPGENRIDIRRLVERGGGRYVRGRVAMVQHQDRALLLEDGGTVRYDAVSFCLGSAARGTDGTVPVKPVSNLEGVRGRLLAAGPEAGLRVLIVGGGAASVLGAPPGAAKSGPSSSRATVSRWDTEGKPVGGEWSRC